MVGTDRALSWQSWEAKEECSIVSKELLMLVCGVGIGTFSCQRASPPFPPKHKVGLFGSSLLFMLGVELGVSHWLTICSATLSIKQKDTKCPIGLRNI